MHCTALKIIPYKCNTEFRYSWYEYEECWIAGRISDSDNPGLTLPSLGLQYYGNKCISRHHYKIFPHSAKRSARPTLNCRRNICPQLRTNPATSWGCSSWLGLTACGQQNGYKWLLMFRGFFAQCFVFGISTGSGASCLNVGRLRLLFSRPLTCNCVYIITAEIAVTVGCLLQYRSTRLQNYANYIRKLFCKKIWFLPFNLCWSDKQLWQLPGAEWELGRNWRQNKPGAAGCRTLGQNMFICSPNINTNVLFVFFADPVKNTVTHTTTSW